MTDPEPVHETLTRVDELPRSSELDEVQGPMVTVGYDDTLEILHFLQSDPALTQLNADDELLQSVRSLVDELEAQVES